MSFGQDSAFCAAAGGTRKIFYIWMRHMDVNTKQVIAKIAAQSGLRKTKLLGYLSGESIRGRIRMKKSFRIVVQVIAICVLGACGKDAIEPEDETMITIIHAEYPLYDTAQELVDEADLVFSGTVESVSYEMLDVRAESGKDSVTGLDQSHCIPYTIYQVKVDLLYKGSSDEDFIYIKCPGGEADENQYVVEGAVTLQEGGVYLFLTKSFENTYPSLLNAAQSAYDMNEPNTLNEGQNGIKLSDILDILQ